MNIQLGALCLIQTKILNQLAMFIEETFVLEPLIIIGNQLAMFWAVLVILAVIFASIKIGWRLAPDCSVRTYYFIPKLNTENL